MRFRVAAKLVFVVHMAGFLRLSPLRAALAFDANNGRSIGLHQPARQQTMRFMTQCIESPVSSVIEDDDEGDKKKKSSKRKHPPPPLIPLPDPSEFPEWAYEPRSFFRFEILHESKKSGARVGRIHTPHGIVDTPGFVAVATNGALKAVDFRDADEAGQQLVFANTYHLLLHPGSEIIRDAGGIHKFTNRNEPFITDSGGFQVRNSGSVESLLCSFAQRFANHAAHTNLLLSYHLINRCSHWHMEVCTRNCRPRES